ncbi:hypothetical protein LTR37_013113 [Vermiconidia calcicola]|uniref:Uncharacterized protein n=1 Tax=Vermiconidia calcicola TaxID=1690605 RepID=A0ACC3MYL0_9PEZI|nr:hypothetical protein LTR37_013113 [Vermiconidia calcicola]
MLASLGLFVGQESISNEPLPDFTFSKVWQVLGPFQIGTREVTWGADPLEFHGGFHGLEYDPNATFKSSLVFNGTTSWSTTPVDISYEGSQKVSADLSVSYPDVQWQWLRETYGWAALQWQGWARGEIWTRPDEDGILLFDVEGAIEYWIDDVHYFGGDFYSYKKAPVTLRLSPGAHRIDVRLVRDIRAMGGEGTPSINVRLELKHSIAAPGGALVPTEPGTDGAVLMSDIVGGNLGKIASEYASVNVRNDADRAIYIYAIKGTLDKCEFELVADKPLRLVPGQTRPVAFRIACVPPYDQDIEMELKWHFVEDDLNMERTMYMNVRTRILNSIHEPHKVTFLHPGGMVSYAILRPPSPNAASGEQTNRSLPVLLALHGAGLEADSDQGKYSFQDLPDLCAWLLFPTGVTPWSADDWHVWGMADVEAAVASIPRWIDQVEWTGHGVEIGRWLISGHSNGGQGVWYTLTHRPDKVIAAAAVSGYSSLQNYVPYTFWHTSDPGREVHIQAALLNYRHELLLENAQDIPVIQQHGSDDDNVPVYHSRLLSERTNQAGAASTFFEMPGKPHYWDGIMTTKPLGEFFKEQLATERASQMGPPVNLREFSIVVASPGETGSKNGVQVLELITPGQLGRMHFVQDPLTRTCMFQSSNIRDFRLGGAIFDDCQMMTVDGQNMSGSIQSGQSTKFRRTSGKWQVVDEATSSEHWGRQLGGLDAVLRSKGAFKIVRHSLEAEHVALQISRNLCTYFGADTDIVDEYDEALQAKGNVISVAVGGDLPKSSMGNHPFNVFADAISVPAGGDAYIVWEEGDNARGLTAVFLRPLPNGRLELVVWGVDAKALETGARLVPMLTGSGQPDFIVADRAMLSKGLEGVYGLGFFTADWEISSNSFLVW